MLIESSVMPPLFSVEGNGFLGVTVLDHLLAKDHKVTAAVRAQSLGEKL